MLINIAVNLKSSKMKMNENECTILSSKLSTNRVGVKINNYIAAF